jgi:hypothetical protein
MAGLSKGKRKAQASRRADDRIEPFAQCLERSERVYLFRPADPTNRQGAPAILDNAFTTDASHHLQLR